MSRYLTYLLIHQRKKKRNAAYNRAQKNLQKRGLAFLAILLVALTIIPVIIGINYARITKDLPSTEWLGIYMNAENGTLLYPTTVYDRGGQTILYQLNNANSLRRFISIDPNSQEFISPYLVQFTVDIYEPDFWTSTGYNNDWLNDDKPLTIAERLVDRLLLWQEPPGRNHNLRRRLLAAQITRKYGRTQILEWFLNSSSYGHLTIGADAAAELYFNKPVSQLKIGEAAVLTAVSQTPSLNPIDAPLAAIENQQKLLKTLNENQLLTDKDYQDALAEVIQFAKEPREQQNTARAFSRLVINQLIEMFGQERVELGGYRVISSLDMNIHNAVSCTTNIQLLHLSGNTTTNEACQPARFLPNVKNPSLTQTKLNASSLVMDPQTGEVLALIGDSDGLSESPFLSLHQAGSTLTPLIAVNAFARGFSPASQVWDIPADLTEETNEFVEPAANYHGPMRFRTAFANNYLTPITRLFEQLGANLIWRSAQSFGMVNIPDVTSPQSLLYEGQSASVLEIGQLYSTFATGGIRYGVKDDQTGLIKPVIIRNIETLDHTRIYEHNSPDEQAIVSQQLAYLVHDLLQDEYERRATLGYPNLLEIGRPTAAKYGGTYKQDEVWATGYTRQYIVVVWVGDQGTNTDENIQIVDPKYAGGVWYALMQWLHNDLPVLNWPQPDGISEKEVCELSGLLPTRQCPSTVKEIFIDGTEPVGYDNLFKSYEINRETELLATVFTSPELIEKRTYMVIPEEAMDWAIAAGIKLPPKNYDSIHAPATNKDVNISSPLIYSFVHGMVNITGTAAGAELGKLQTTGRIRIKPAILAAAGRRTI